MGGADKDGLFGSLLVGSWVNAMIFVFETTQVFRYFHRNPSDPTRVKAMVCFAYAADFATTTCICATVYLYTITHWGDSTFAGTQPWPVPAYVMCTSLTAVTVQSFLIRRYYTLSDNKIVSLGLLFLSISSLIGGLTTGGMILNNDNFDDRDSSLIIPVTTWLAISAATDWGIAIALVWELYIIKTYFGQTRSLIQRIAASTIQTGCTTSMVALVSIVYYIVDKQSNIPTAVAFLLGRAYSITMLYNLNMRRRRVDPKEKDVTTGTVITRTTTDGTRTNGDLRFAHSSVQPNSTAKSGDQNFELLELRHQVSEETCSLKVVSQDPV